MRKRVLSVMLAASMAISGLVGCGAKTSGNESAATKGASSTAAGTEEQKADANFNETGYPIVKEPITLKVMLAIRDVDSLVDINDMPAIQALEQETGI
ncbi:MAG: hypothetical protein RR621_09865, partial [Lachnospiraceae bacterium]